MARDCRAKQSSLWQDESVPRIDELPLPLPDGGRLPGRAGRDIRVGTSGFSFDDWRGSFYPPDLPASQRLSFYARYFPLVEINSTYYGIPRPRVMENLVARTPDGFGFLVKANRQMTHETAAGESVHAAFRDCLQPLIDSDRLEGVLAQFPWRFRDSTSSRRQILEISDQLGERPLFVEFRHRSWIHDELFGFLNDHGIGYCSVDEPRLEGLVPPLARLTGNTAYVRFHGRNDRTWWGRGEGDRYDYDYRREELREWVSKIHELAERAEKTYVLFNNCHAGQAARNARLMMDMLQEDLA